MAALPVRLLPPTAAVRAEGLRGAALRVPLHLLLPTSAVVVVAAAAPKGHTPLAIHLLLLLPRLVAVVGVGAAVAEAVVVAMGAVVVEVTVAVAMPFLKRRS